MAITDAGQVMTALASDLKGNDKSPCFYNQLIMAGSIYMVSQINTRSASLWLKGG